MRFEQRTEEPESGAAARGGGGFGDEQGGRHMDSGVSRGRGNRQHLFRPAARAAPAEFSAARALDHLRAIAGEPHPMGSREHAHVRDYLVAQLSALGGNPEIQRTTGVTALYQVAGSVENIVARWKGTSGGPDAIALVAHYDSVA